MVLDRTRFGNWSSNQIPNAFLCEKEYLSRPKFDRHRPQFFSGEHVQSGYKIKAPQEKEAGTNACSILKKPICVQSPARIQTYLTQHLVGRQHSNHKTTHFAPQIFIAYSCELIHKTLPGNTTIPFLLSWVCF
jgi:hypothetical protein